MEPYVRPQTPQALIHRAPIKPDAAENSLTKPSKYIILLLAPTSVAGKVQIATSVSESLSCPLFQGDSLHESSAKAADVGASRSEDGGKGRYQRMWFNKMTRTGLLFPEESRPATEGFYGFGGEPSSTSTSRRGSGSSISSTNSLSGGAMASSTSQYVNRSVLATSEEARRRESNPALMVLTHPKLDAWHKDAIRDVTVDYGVGIIFVPLFEHNTAHDDELEVTVKDELPVLRPLDPTTISAFTSFDALRAAVAMNLGGGKQLKYGQGKEGTLGEEMVLEVDIGGRIEEIIEEVVRGVKDIMFAK